MKRTANIFEIIFTLAIFFVCAVPIFAQTPTPRPLSPEFQKRRQAGIAFQYGRLFLLQRKPAGYQTAIKNFQLAAKLYDELGDKPSVGCALIGLGLVENELGKNISVVQTYQQALTIFRLFDGKNISETALGKLGFLYNELVDKRRFYRYDSLEIELPKEGFDRNGDRIDTRFSQIGERYTVQFFNQSFDVYASPNISKPEDSRYAGSGDSPKYVNFYKETLAIWKLNGLESLEVAIRVNLMELWAKTNPQIAIFYGKQAINRYQELSKSIQQTKYYRVRPYRNQLPDKYRFLADLLIANGQFTDAEQVLQMLKEEEFSEFIKRDANEIKNLNQRVTLNEKERGLIKRYGELADKIAEIGQEFLNLDDKKRQLAEQKQTLAADEQNRYEQLSAQIKDANDSFKLFVEKDLGKELSTTATKNIELDSQLQEKLRQRGNGTVALYTVISENRYRVILTTPNLQIDGKTEMKAADLNKKIFDFRDALQNKTIDPRPLGKEIYDILLKPIEKELKASKAKTLVWSLDGVLRYIPLAALSPDGKTYLIEQYQNVLLTSKTRDDLPNSNKEWLALGMGISEEQTVFYPENPNEKFVLSAIPGTKSELLTIIQDENNPTEKGIFKGKRFLDGDFSLVNLQDSLATKTADGMKKFSVVHFASHFRLGNNWSESFLLLGNAKLLTLQDIVTSPTINFDDVELVTLSACKTAVDSDSSGKEVESLAGAIQTKGGRTVMATLWDVVDASTSLLMSNFYRLKKQNPRLTKAEALQKAQIEMIQGVGQTNKARFAHPYYWSPFVLLGNWR
jgi:CHAT domain-containing protein